MLVSVLYFAVQASSGVEEIAIHACWVGAFYLLVFLPIRIYDLDWVHVEERIFPSGAIGMAGSVCQLRA